MRGLRRGGLAVAVLVGSAVFAWTRAEQGRAETPSPVGPVPAKAAAARMTLPVGFTATLFAAEPDVHQPIAFTIDPRGRLWVAENYSYPNWKSKPSGKDRILIFEDVDGDGKFDKRKVFWDGAANITGVALGFGGVWVCDTPNLLFVPDADGDDVPDGPAVVKLDGWDVKAQHNMFNALTWAPDGWLWGCNGIMSNSRVGKPGTPDGDRVAINCGVWRYHPTKGTFEVVAHGTTNPWGLDFDDVGDAYITNCVLPHLYRVVPGAHFERMYGQDFLANSYGLIGSTADHIHWAGGNWTESREGKGKHGEAGGGHAHVGAMIYLGDNWPDRYRNGVFTCNLHGHRVNHDRLETKGSGTVARHEPDFLMANDDWFRGLELKYGPDGGVYLTDWSDTGECHETDADLSHRENGRIYKIRYGDARPVSVDLAKLSDEDLARLQTHRNDWYVRTARRLLQERAAAGKDMTGAHAALEGIFKTDPDVRHKLRAWWAMQVTGGLGQVALMRALEHPEEHIRRWGVRFLEDRPEDLAAAAPKLAEMAKREASALVRLELASAMQKLPKASRWEIAEGLSGHRDDANDLALPLMIWYGTEPLFTADPERAVNLTTAAKIPLIRRYLARRAATPSPDSAHPGLAALVAVLDRSDDPALRGDVLAGMLDAQRGQRSAPMPKGWPALSARLIRVPELSVREPAMLLSLLFGDAKATATVRAIASDANAAPDERARALQALVEARVPDLAADLHPLLDQPAMRGPALRALAAVGDASSPRAIIDRYGSFSETDRADAVATLSARPATARLLLDALEKGTIPRRDVSSATARQILAFKDRDLSARLERAWGALRPTSGAKAAQMAKYKALLSSDPGSADPSRGRDVFRRSCAQCHKLFDSGGDVGPDLTGSGRADLSYILENVLDPSAAVGQDYRLTTVATTDGRLLSGIIRSRDARSLTLQTPNERVIVPLAEVEAEKTSSESMMPEGLFEKLSPSELRDLIAYLAAKSQTPLPADSPRD